VEGDLYFRDNPAVCQSLVDTIVEATTVLGWGVDLAITDNVDC
jgi:hypothetical protein